MLFLLAQHIDAQMSQKMPIAWHVWQKQCSECHSLLSKEIQVRSILKLSNKASYSTLRTHQKTCTQVLHSLMQAISMRKCFNHKPLLWGAHTLTWQQEKHAKLCASLITFYPICMDVQTDAMKPHQPYPWTIGSVQSAIGKAIPTLWPSFPLPWHAFLWITSPHSSKLPYKQHSLQPRSEGESLPHLCTFLVLIRTKKWRHPEEPSMVSKCKHTKQDGQQTHAEQYLFIALLFHIQENANAALTASKYNTSTWLLQERRFFYWHSILMHKCPKRCQSHGMFGKSNALNETFFAFKENSSAVRNQTEQQSFLFNPQNSSKNMHTKYPIPSAGHLHEKMLQPQTTSWGSSHTHVTARNSCQTMCIINHILSHMHGCANWCHETSSTLSMDNWLNPVCHCQCHSHTLTFISTTFWHAFLWITSLHSSQITLLAAFTSAPFWRRISTTSLCPLYADTNKGVAPSWGIQHCKQMQTHKRGWSANKCWTISVYCPFILHLGKCKHSIDCVKP